jgi:soluble lytic murein transglycosylase-like protein
VTLRNGFEMQCNHHAQVEGRTRLYLTAGDDNYIEFAPEEIVAVAAVPDPPAQARFRTSAQWNGIGPGKTAEPKAGAEARLSTADLREMLAKAGSEHNLDADLLASLVKAESGGNARAVSRAGARGLMQLMPGTATDAGSARQL